MKYTLFALAIFFVYWLTSCTVGVGPDGSYYTTLDAKGAIIVGSKAYEIYRERHPIHAEK